MHRWDSKIKNKPRLRVRACNEAWSFSYQGVHIGAIWYDGTKGVFANKLYGLIHNLSNHHVTKL